MLRQSYQIEKNKIIFNNGRVIEFENTFRQTLVIADILIVIIEFIKNKKTNENVYGIDLERQSIKWQIENKREDDCAFTDMIEGKNQHLYLRSWCNLILEVNPNTGEIYSKSYGESVWS